MQSQDDMSATELNSAQDQTGLSVVTARNASRRMATIALGAAILVSLLFLGLILATWVAPHWLSIIPVLTSAVAASPGINWISQAVISGLLLVQGGLGVATLAALAFAFSAMSKSDVLTFESAKWLRVAGVLVLVGVVLSVLIQAPASAALSWSNPPGERMVSISIGSAQITGAIGGGALMALAHVLRCAAAMNAELKQVV